MTTTEGGGENWWFWCPGCETHHIFTTKRGPKEKGPIWIKVKDEITFSPSLICNQTRADPARGIHRCHLFLKKGMVQFLGDCTHKLKGQTLPVESAKF